MKKSKRAKASERKDGVDRISNLPDHVLQLILSCIPSTEEVIRTSILSRRWRYLWTSVPSIDIDITRGLYHLIDLGSNGFKEFMNWVLVAKSFDLDSFRLRCLEFYNMLTIRRWSQLAVIRKVKVVDLVFSPKEEVEEIELPHCLVTCSSLEVLRLCLFGYRLCLPTITGFPALRALELNDVLLNNRGICRLVKYFLESCPLLEDLTLLNCQANDLIISCPKLKNLSIENFERVYNINTGEYSDDRMSSVLEISCPKLVFLSLTGSVAKHFLFENLNSLKKAVIHIKELFDYEEEPTLDVVAEISNVESLSISLDCVAMCYHSRLGLGGHLPNLKTLEITVNDALHMLIPFLICVPDIESLHLIFVKDVAGLDYCSLKQLPLEEPATMIILTRHLKKVEFLEFNMKIKKKLGVARALLEHGSELEEMVFSWGDEARFHERAMKTMNKVSKFHKASSAVQLRAVFEPPRNRPRPSRNRPEPSQFY